jgi:hypothetical protein
MDVHGNKLVPPHDDYNLPAGSEISGLPRELWFTDKSVLFRRSAIVVVILSGFLLLMASGNCPVP